MAFFENRTDIPDRHPATVDVVVIGGGIVGVTAAYYLAEKGVRTVLLEKGVIAGEQSSRNWGWLRQQNRPVHELPMAQFALRAWEDLSKVTGDAFGFFRGGTLFATEDPADMALWEAWCSDARAFGLDSRVLSATEAREMAKGSDRPWIGGLFTRTDARAEPTLAAPAIARAAFERGVAVHQNCAVRGLDVQSGRIVGVVTEKGRIRAPAVICAGGIWSTMLARRHGINLPQVGVRTSAIRTAPVSGVMDGQLMTPGFSIRKRLDGGLTIGLRSRGTIELTKDSFRYARQFLPGYLPVRKKLSISLGRPFWDSLMQSDDWSLEGPSPFEQTRILDPKPNPKIVKLAIDGGRAAIPALRGIAIAESWGGMLDFTPDQLPVISAVDDLSGFYLATGCSGHGFGIGPAIGAAAAALALGDEPPFDLCPFRFSRMHDGSKLVPHGL